MSIGVDYAGMGNVAQEIRRVAKKLEQELANLRTEVKKVGDSWEGEAKTAFDTADKQWQLRATGMQASLAKMANEVESASSKYKATDARAAKEYS